jgi:hypothetical protein
MKTKLTLSVDRDTLAKARRRLSRRRRTISAEVDDLLKRIAAETEPERMGWIEQFGDLEIPLDLDLAEQDTPTGRQLRSTAAYRRAKTGQRKKNA